MSLIAAVAVTGMTSTVCAQPLEEAIKGVDFSGNLRYRYTDNKEAAKANSNEYRLEMTVKSKINEMATATVSTNTKNTGGTSTVATTTTDDADPVATYITEANFAFALPGATVIAGKQALATPFASGQAEDQQGTGVVALIPVAGATVAAGLYLNSDAKSTKAANGVADVDLGDNNIAAVAVIGKASVVDYAAWYAKVSEIDLANSGNAAYAGITAGATAMNLNVKVPVGPVNVEVNYAKVDYVSSNGTIDAQSPTQSRIVLSGKVDAVSLVAGMVIAGKDGADVTLGDDDSSANFGAMERFTGIILKDTTAYYLAAFAPVGPVTAGLEYGTASEATGSGTDDASEMKLSVAYKMSKNFTVSAYATQTTGALDNLEQNRVEIKYTF